jgi:beta-N-acetylhexosaminidase
MLVTGFAGTKAADPGVQAARRAAEAGHMGGILLQQFNIESPVQLRQLIAHVRTWQVPLPLLVCISQEGGNARRLGPTQGFEAYPAAHQVAEAGTDAATTTYGSMAQALADLDIDLNLAPVVDLHHPRAAAIGAQGRSFGSDPNTVIRMATAFISAHRRAGVATAVKHFVGEGAAVNATRRGAAEPIETTGVGEDTAALAPFAHLIDTGLVDVIVTSHLRHARLEPSGAPLTFSRATVTGLLRQELDFAGVIMSDDLSKGAVTQHFTFAQSCGGALAAGHDMLLISQNTAASDDQAPSFDGVPELWPTLLAVATQQVATGERSEGAFADSYARICRLKMLQRPAP